MFLKSTKSDSALLALCRDHKDADAFDVLFRRHKDAFYRFLLTLAGDAAIAEDVSQQCWLRLLEALTDEATDRAVAPRSFKSYLFSMGRNLYIDHYVRRHEHACRSDEDVYELIGADTSGPEHQAQQIERTDDTLRALATLPEAQREVIALWAGGMDIDSIARLTDAPRNTVLSRKRYAVAKLRDEMAPHAPQPAAVLSIETP
ncbi:MAG: sigma-70 family RNA polymerase sigma factor [Pseudomonadota bacterium]